MTHADLCRLCQLAYTTVPNAVQIGDRGPRAWFIEGDPCIVVFRGSADLQQWWDDLDAVKILFYRGMVHKGIRDGWYELADDVEDLIRNRHVIFTGHSAGGGHATLAAYDFAHTQFRLGQIETVEVVTFGCLRVSNSAFRDDYAKCGLDAKTTRYVNQGDPVPHWPTILRGFRHVCPERFFDGEKWGPWQAWEWAKASVNPFSDLTNHFISSYVAAMEKPCPQN